MLLGEKIKRIRTFRGLTQRELGLQLGYDEKNADVRIAQYESSYRVPKKETLMDIAKILDVNYLNFYIPVPGAAEDIIQTLFWLDEENRNMINLFKLTYLTHNNNVTTNAAMCSTSDDCSIESPIGMWFNYPLVDEYFQEWYIKKNQLHEGLITENEYFEWKLNWPSTCANFKNVK